MRLKINDSEIIWPGKVKKKPEGFFIPTHLKVLTIEEKPFVYVRKLTDDEVDCEEDEIPCPHFNQTDGNGMNLQKEIKRGKSGLNLWSKLEGFAERKFRFSSSAIPLLFLVLNYSFDWWLLPFTFSTQTKTLTETRDLSGGDNVCLLEIFSRKALLKRSLWPW